LGVRGFRATAFATTGFLGAAVGFFGAGVFFAATAGTTSATNGIVVVAAGSGILYGADMPALSSILAAGLPTKKFLIADKNDIKSPFGYVKHIYSNCQCSLKNVEEY
jgi:hypothetical protein